MVNIVKSFWIKLNKLQQMHLKLLQKEQFKKTAEVVIQLVIKLLTTLQRFQRFH